MNVLVLQPGPLTLGWAIFKRGTRAAASGGSLPGYRERDNGEAALDALAAQVAEIGGVGAVAIVTPFGGERFRGATLADDETLDALESMAGQAPLHLPIAVALARAAAARIPQAAVVLLFQSAFFAPLPGRERLYALEAGLLEGLSLRPYGQCGLWHEAACREATRQSRQSGVGRAPRVISLCMEGRPEIAAAIATRPVMTTAGLTPLEGLPGQNSCGELDPTIVLTLAHELKMGPEAINRLLARDSGLSALAGRPVEIGPLLEGDAEEDRLARELLRYRIVQQCGAAMAAMGGVDMLVFSGRWARLAERLGPWLADRLTFRNRTGQLRPAWIRLEEPLERIAADAAMALLMTHGVNRCA